MDSEPLAESDHPETLPFSAFLDEIKKILDTPPDTPQTTNPAVTFNNQDLQTLLSNQWNHESDSKTWRQSPRTPYTMARETAMHALSNLILAIEIDPNHPIAEMPEAQFPTLQELKNLGQFLSDNMLPETYTSPVDNQIQ